ncbi:protein kinase [uncultured Paludibaculum sp.]|uniref:serine/threonine protein kinase n=1 Tax=uncultured Paludibaculum sp. TaxID=1765020 RepID=UPI002AABB2A5|nr:protein kinase [uncultured Paludibaculum sp.]
MTAKTVGNYRFTRQLGAGGMGAVFEAIDVMVDRRVAIKMLRSEIASQPDLIERFRVEAATLAKLSHPCTATLFSFFRDGEDYYMVMEFVPGHTLEEILKRSGPLPVETAVSVMLQVLQGVSHAHSMGVLHRDIKPANIMITDDGHVKVTDFGIARVLGSSHLTRAGSVIGTLEYLAPERIRWEEADIRSDIYSVGVVLFETLTGRMPFTGDTDHALLQAHLELPPPSLWQMGVECDPALDAVVHRALEKRQDARFQSAQEFHDALAAVPIRTMKPTRLASPPPAVAETRLATAPLAATRLAPTIQAIPPRRRLLLWSVAGLAAMLTVVSGVTIWILRRPAPVVAPAPVVEAVRSAPASMVPVPAPAPALPAGLLDPPAPTSSTAPIVPAQSPRVTEKPIAPPRTAPVPQARKPLDLPPIETAAPAVKPPEPIEQPRAAAPPIETPPPPPARPAVRSLRDVKTVFVEKMQNDLDSYIKAEIAEQMPEYLAVVRRREDADAILSGRSEETSTTGSKVTGGYLGIKDQARGAVRLRDHTGRVDLWSAEAGDKAPIIGALKRGGSKKVAERLVGNLRKAMKATR